MSDNHEQQNNSVPERLEELVSLAQKYFSHEFPKSGHGCPSPSEIVEVIESGRLPEDALLEHLLMCSRCFKTYKEHLQRSRDFQSGTDFLPQRNSVWVHFQWVRILVPSLSALFIVAIAVIYLRPKNPQEKVTLVNRAVEVANANAGVVTTPSPSPERTEPANNIERATHVARVDLRNYSPQRGRDPGVEPPPIQIGQKPTAFAITLPQGSPPGRYAISIVNAFGETIKERTSYSVDGKKVTAILNLDNLRSQKYRLCVSRSDEAPNCYPVVITSRGK